MKYYFNINHHEIIEAFYFRIDKVKRNLTTDFFEKLIKNSKEIHTNNLLLAPNSSAWESSKYVFIKNEFNNPNKTLELLMIPRKDFYKTDLLKTENDFFCFRPQFYISNEDELANLTITFLRQITKKEDIVLDYSITSVIQLCDYLNHYAVNYFFFQNSLYPLSYYITKSLISSKPMKNKYSISYTDFLTHSDEDEISNYKHYTIGIADNVKQSGGISKDIMDIYWDSLLFDYQHLLEKYFYWQKRLITGL